jgi:hypothetical protein
MPGQSGKRAYLPESLGTRIMKSRASLPVSLGGNREIVLGTNLKESVRLAVVGEKVQRLRAEERKARISS